MQELRAKLEEYMKNPNQTVLLVAIGVMIVIAILCVLILFAGEGKIKIEEPAYQYFADQRIDFKTGTKFKLKKYGVIIIGEDERKAGDESPIYYFKHKAFVIPADMSWLNTDTGTEWKIPALSKVFLDDKGMVWCETEKKKVQLNGGILNDGMGTYIFLQDGNVTINGEKYDLKAFSFYSSANGIWRIYEYEEDNLVYIEKASTKAIARSVSGYNVDMTAGVYTSSQGSVKMLSADPTVLRDINRK